VDLQADPRRFTYVTTIKEHILEKKHGSTVTKHDCRHGAFARFSFFPFLFCFWSKLLHCLTH
jgi:carotenoid cleavage dioxygenase-like enzyme